MLPPDGLEVSVQLKPVLLPPLAEKSMVPPTAIVGDAGVMPTAGPTVIVAVATSLIPSVAVTTSVVGPVGPAVYSPVAAAIDPPELLVVNVHVMAPEPPVVLKVSSASGATVTVAGKTARFGTTCTTAVAKLPRESVTLTTSELLVAPAV